MTVQETQGSSWGEDLRIYKDSKSNVPWTSDQQKPVSHITRYQKSREERQYDIILGSYRDTEKEHSVQQKSNKDNIKNLNKAKDKQLRYTQTFDLINHKSKYQGLNNDPNETFKSEKSRAENHKPGYNIISGLDFHDHHFDEPSKRPQRASTAFAEIGRTKLNMKSDRSFNLINNRYFENHDEQHAKDQNQEKEKAADRFWKTHTYNPIETCYYDKEKEKSYEKEKEKQWKSQQEHRKNLLPPGEKYSEGSVYNIVNHALKDDKKITKFSEIVNRSVNSKNCTSIEKNIKQKSEELSDLKDTRSFNRISYQRFAESRMHGYDLLTNQPYKGRNNKNVVQIMQEPKPPGWQKLDIQKEFYEKGGSMNKYIDISNGSRQTKQKPDILEIHRSVETSPSSSRIQNQTLSQSESLTQNTSNIKSNFNVPPIKLHSANAVSQNPMVRTGGF